MTKKERFEFDVCNVAQGRPVGYKLIDNLVEGGRVLAINLDLDTVTFLCDMLNKETYYKTTEG